jgi:hypothetical protein
VEPLKIILRSWFGALSVATIGGFLVFSLWTAHSVFILDITSIYKEDGPMENIQVILLAISCIFFLIPIALEKKSEKLILLFCSLLCYTFILREINLNRPDFHKMVRFFGSGIGKNMSITVAFIALVSYAAFRFSYYKKAAIFFIRSKSGILLMSGGFFLIIGDLFEKTPSIIHYVYWEELFELCGDCFILLSAFAANPGLNRTGRPI